MSAKRKRSKGSRERCWSNVPVIVGSLWAWSREYADFRDAYEYLRSEGRVVAATSGGHQNLRWHEEVEACLCVL